MSAITQLSSTLSSAVNTVQKKIATTQTELATNVNPSLSPIYNSVILTLSNNINTWGTRSTNLNTTNDIVRVAQTGLSSISSLLYEMQTLAISAESTTGTSDLASLNATYQSLATQINTIANNATIGGTGLLNTTSGITIYPALSTSVTSTVYGYDYASIGSALTTAYPLSSNSAAVTAATQLATYIESVTAAQASMSAYSSMLTLDSTAATAFASSSSSYISDLQGLNTTTLQTDLTGYNNQLDVDYYLIGQMNSAASAALTIFK